jgi:hypothetical protein
MFIPTLEDIKNDPEFYAELVNDLMYHVKYGIGTTQIMKMAMATLDKQETFEDFCEFKNGL